MAVEERTTSSTGGQKGVKLARFELIPAGPLHELAVHYGRGARKYASHQWRQGYEWSKSMGALERHYNDFKAGKDYDVCSNEPENCAVRIDTGEVLSYDANKARFYLENEQFVVIEVDGNRFRLETPLFEPDTCYNHTGSHHMVAVAWHAFLLLEFKDHYPNFDDRFKYPENSPESLDEQLSQSEKDRLFRVEP